MVINDLLCGFLVCLFSLLSLKPHRSWAVWAVAFIGLWLNLAPLVFWVPEAAVYNSDSILGTLIIAFAVIIPGVPGSAGYERQAGDIPRGWSYNPSDWLQRIPIILLGWIGFFSARHLAAFQLNYIDSAWDPFFDKGTENVLNSDISKAWPVSDAGLGAFSYMIDAMMGYLGAENRWRTMPWAVILFGILIIPLGIVSITLIILQPLAVGSWCSVCIFTAIVMLLMIPCAFDEVFATLQFLGDSRKQGKSRWKTFWYGGEIQGERVEVSGHDFSLPLHKTVQKIFADIAVPWNLLVSVGIGIWLMFSPLVLQYGDYMADSDHLTGALIITFSVIAMGEVVRAVRFVNTALGIWLLAAPFLFECPAEALYNSLVCGILLVLLSIRKGRIMYTYGSFDKYIV